MCNEGFDILIEFYLEYVQRMNNIATFRKSFCAFVQRRIFFFSFLQLNGSMLQPV